MNQEVDGMLRTVVVEQAHWQDPEIDAISLETIMIDIKSILLLSTQEHSTG